MRTFLYCRVSTKEQGTQDHYSLDNQEQRCRDYMTILPSMLKLPSVSSITASTCSMFKVP